MNPIALDRNKRRTGLTMVEVAIAIVIGLIVLAGLGYLVYKSESGNKQTALTEQLNVMAQGIRTTYHGQSSFTGLSNTVAINAGDVPTTLITSKSSGTLTNPWNGTVTIAPDSTTTEFDITYTQVPQDICLNTLTGGAVAIKAVKTGSTSILPGPNGAITVANAQSACSSSSNSVTFVFGK